MPGTHHLTRAKFTTIFEIVWMFDIFHNFEFFQEDQRVQAFTQGLAYLTTDFYPYRYASALFYTSDY